MRLLSQKSLPTCKKLKTDDVLVTDLHQPGLWTVEAKRSSKNIKHLIINTVVDIGDFTFS